MTRGSNKIRAATGNLNLDIDVKQLLDGIEDDLLIIGSDYRIRFANSALRDRYLKGSADDITGEYCYKVFPRGEEPCNTPSWNCPLKEVLQKHKPLTVLQSKGMLASDRYIKITAYPLQDSHGSYPFIAEFRRDVSADRELESQILRRHHQLLALQHISSAVSGLSDLDTILGIALDDVLEIVDGAIGGILLLDFTSKTLFYRIQYGLSAVYAEQMRMRLGEGIAGKVAETGEPVLLDDISKSPEVVHPDLVNSEGLKSLISIPLKAKMGVVGVMNIASQQAGRFSKEDLSLLTSIGDYLGTAIEQARLYRGLSISRERYKRLLHHALTTQEEERKRIARELHDETSQAITSVTLNLQTAIGIAEMHGLEDGELMDRLKTTHSCAVRAGNEIVKLMKDLRPTLLDELGLPAAINRYAKDTLQTKEINVATEFIGTDRRFGPEVEITMFRVAQGLIGNILEHSEAKNVSIKLECDEKECRLQVRDDGKGFEVKKLTRVDPSGRGTGLFTLKERVSLVGGNCVIESRPTQGTNVIVKIPIPADAVVDTDEEDKGAGGR